MWMSFGPMGKILSFMASYGDKPYIDPWGLMTGNQSRVLQKYKAQKQIGYEQYLRRGNERAKADWYRNVGNKYGRTIRYPEFSYSGQIARSNTAIASNYVNYVGADSSYYGNLPYKLGGLYGIGSRTSRYL